MPQDPEANVYFSVMSPYRIDATILMLVGHNSFASHFRIEGVR